VQVNEEVRQEEHMLEMLESEKQDLENEVCRFRVTKAKLLQQIAYVSISYLCHYSGNLLLLPRKNLPAFIYLMYLHFYTAVSMLV